MTEAIPESWRAALEPALATAEARQLGAFLRTEEAAGKRIFPPRGTRLAALELTPLDAVKVVILGQDPYHGAGQAHGLAFSVQKGVKVPPSLRNIYKELASDLGLPVPDHGNLEHWARQGVLLLNTVLTVEEGQAGSHQQRGWEAITDAVVAAVAGRAEPVVFLLWGNHARAKAARVPGLHQPSMLRTDIAFSPSGERGGRGGHAEARPHLILTAPHPSPLSAYAGFFGCHHFSQTNAFLEAQGRQPIDWHP